MKTVRIGGASAFFADSTQAVGQLIAADPYPKYLMFDFMSEGTIGMMAKSLMADPDGGYVKDIVGIHIAANLPEIKAKGVKILANAGGMNPKGCAEAVEKLLAERDIPLKVAYVEGDNILSREAALRAAGSAAMFSGEAFPDQVDSINVYLGAFPVARALDEGADIIITGRCADSALGLAPLIHEFGWKEDDWDKLSAGTLVGHLLECSCQVTGGTFTDWEDVPDWHDMGYPIAEVTEDGSFVVTKPAGTGGLVSVGTVSEQLLYEVSDPQAYVVADVVCDWSDVKITQAGPNRVAVSGARGYPATDTYKGVASTDKGWRGMFTQVIVGMDAPRKAKKQGEALIARGRTMLRGRNLGDFERSDVEVVGAEQAYGPHGRANDVREVLLRSSVDHRDRAGVEMYLRECSVTPSVMSVGSTATLSHSMMPLSKLHLFLTPKRDVPVMVTVSGRTIDLPNADGVRFDPATLVRPVPPAAPDLSGDLIEVPLVRVAYGRSGDKGNLFNVAAIARKPEYLPYIRAAITPEVVADRFAFLYPEDVKPRVSTFDVPGFHAVNFVLHDSMDGGILMSPRVDNAAKGMAQQFLELPVKVPVGLLG